jgi:hypothetical protein
MIGEARAGKTLPRLSHLEAAMKKSTKRKGGGKKC